MLVLNLGRKHRIDHLEFSPDGRALVASATAGLYIWRDFADGQTAARLPSSSYPGLARFTADGRWLFTTRSELTRIDPATGACESCSLWGSYGARFDPSPTEPVILVTYHVPGGPTNRARIGLWRTDDLSATGKVWEHEMEGFAFYAPRFLPSGEQFIRAEVRWLADQFRNEFSVARYSAADGERIGQPILLPFNAYDLSVSPDGCWLAHRNANHIELAPLEPAAGPVACIRNDNRKHFTDAAFHPSGKCIAATNNDRTVKLYDTATWQESRAFTWDIGRMRSIAFTPDGALAAAGSDTGQVIVWDVDL